MSVSAVKPPEFTGKNNLPVVRWKPLSARLFAGGLSIEEISKELGVGEGEVNGWLTGHEGRKMVQESAGHGKQAARRILEGQRLSNILTIMRLRDGAKSETVKLNAANALQKMIDGEDLEYNVKSPEEQKAALESAMSKFLDLRVNTERDGNE